MDQPGDLIGLLAYAVYFCHTQRSVQSTTLVIAEQSSEHMYRYLDSSSQST